MLARMVPLTPLSESSADMTLPIGYSPAIGRDRLGAELVTFGHERPDIAVGVHEMTRTDLLAALRSGEIALALVPGEPDRGFRTAALWADRALVALPPMHSLAQQALFDPRAAADLLFLVSRRSAGAEVHRFLSRRLFGQGTRLRSDMRDCGLGRILQSVADGQGAALLCDSLDYPARADVALRPVAHRAADFQVHAHWLDERHDSARAALLDQLRATD